MTYLFKGDAYELIKQIPDKSIDLVYTDIPYKTTYGKDKFTTFRFEDSYEVTKQKVAPITNSINFDIIDEMVRVCKRTNIYIWCSVSQMMEIMEHTKTKRHDILVWHKTNALRMNRKQYVTDLEYCLLITDGQGKNNTGGFHSKLYQSANNAVENRKNHHPTCKPEKLVTEHILVSSNPGDTVLDPFMGSGTTGVACEKTGRDFIGFEISDDYFESAKKRIEEAKI